MKALRLLVAGSLAIAAMWAADVTGKWTYEIQGRDGNTVAGTMNLKADGTTLTGTVGGRNGDAEISDGKIDGDNISFNVVREFNGRKMTISYKGKLEGDTIHFTMKLESGPMPNARGREFDAKRSTT